MCAHVGKNEQKDCQTCNIPSWLWGTSKTVYVTGFAKRDHLGLRLDFELGIWSESTLDELSVAIYGASLAATVFEIRWLELRNYANHNMKKTAFESLLPVKPTTFRILPCY